eukprot:24639_1
MAQPSTTTYVEDKPLTPTPTPPSNMNGINGRKPRILVVNDDGVKSSGLKQLAIALEQSIGDVVVVSTIDNQIHPSFSITIQEQIRAKFYEKWGENILVYAVSGFPMNCLKFAYGHVIPKILKWDNLDIVIAGINKGKNIGTDLLYSGTMSLACAARFGNETFMKNNATPKSIAISLCPPTMRSSSSSLSTDTFTDWQFNESVKISVTIVKLLLQSEQTPNVVWNCNIPSQPKKNENKYYCAITKPANLKYDPNNLITILKDDEKLQYNDFIINSPIINNINMKEIKGSDLYALKNNIISISPIEVVPALHTPLHATKNLINFITNNKSFEYDSQYFWEISVNIRPLKCIVQCLEHWLKLKMDNDNINVDNDDNSLLQTYTLYLERDIKICGEKDKFTKILMNQFGYDVNAEKFNYTLTWNKLNQLYDILCNILEQGSVLEQHNDSNLLNMVFKGVMFAAITGVVVFASVGLSQKYFKDSNDNK